MEPVAALHLCETRSTYPCATGDDFLRQATTLSRSPQLASGFGRLDPRQTPPVRLSIGPLGTWHVAHSDKTGLSKA
jgi:hypothetical protein